MTRFPIKPLSCVLTQRKEFIEIDDLALYKRCRVQLQARGVVLRDRVPGSQIRTKHQQFCRAGEFLVAEIDAKSGGFGVVPPELDGAIVSSHYFLFQVDPSALDTRFLSYYTQTPGFLGQVQAQGSTNYAAIRPADVLSYTVPLPPVAEQRRIVTRIEQLAAKIRSARDYQAATAPLAEALIPALLNKLIGDPYANVSGALEWRSHFVRLGDVITDVADGPHVTPTYVPMGVPFVTVLNISSGRLNFAGAKYVTEADHREFQKRARAERGDVLISKDGSIGIPCFVDTDKEFSFFVSVALVKPLRDRLDGRFLTWVLRAPYLQRRMRERSRGDMIRHLVLREIRELHVPAPPISDQLRVVAQLDRLSAKVSASSALQKASTVQLDALQPSVLDRAFKGEL